MSDLIALVRSLEQRLEQPLPGTSAHEAFRAVPVGGVRPRFEHTVPPRPGSVLILLYEKDGLIKFPLIKRPDYSGMHSGQVSFPGGKAEAGEDFIETAVREGHEEIGVIPDAIRIIGRLTNFFVIPSNFMVTPVIGFIEAPPLLKPDPIEVARILTADLNEILPDSAIKRKEITVAGQFQMLAPHFEIENEVVWGATAMMLNEFRMILREIL